MQRLIGRHGDPMPRVQAIIDQLLTPCSNPCVLEAGCGSLSRIKLPSQSQLIGIDISPRQLARNSALHEKVLGDLQTYQWPNRRFDLIVCWDVIEHLSAPGAALDNMIKALRPGGTVLLAFPNLWSLKGLVTKFTPFGFHAWFYRRILGDPRRDEDLDQFPTSLCMEIAPQRLRERAARHNLAVNYEEIYEGPVQTHMRERSIVFDMAFAALGLISRILSLGRLDLGLSDCVMIMQLRTSTRADASEHRPDIGFKGMPGLHVECCAPLTKRLQNKTIESCVFDHPSGIKPTMVLDVVPPQHEFAARSQA